MTTITDLGLSLPAANPERAAASASIEMKVDVPTGFSDALRAEAIDFRGSLVALDGDDEVASLDITFASRAVSDTAGVVRGQDMSQSMSVWLTTRFDEPVGKVGLEFKPNRDALPNDFLPVAEFVEALRDGRTLGVRLHEPPGWLGRGPVTGAVGVPAGYVATVRSLARLQDWCGVRFPMPEAVTREEADLIDTAMVLIDGGTVEARWTEVTVEVDEQTATIFDDTGEFGIFFEAWSSFDVQIGSHVLPIGLVAHRFGQAHRSGSEPHASGLTVVRLRSGKNDVVRLELATEEERRLLAEAHGKQQLPPGELERLAGLWIAQIGPELIAASESREDVVAAARGRTPAARVWRVPKSPEEWDTEVVGL